MPRYTLGKYVVVIIMFLIAFDFLFAAIQWYVNYLDYSLSSVAGVTGGSSGVFGIFVDFLKSAWSWVLFLFTNSIAFAAIIFISLLYEASESGWK